MPSEAHTGPAKREEVTRTNRRHALLKTGTPHFAVWTTIVTDGNPHGGMTAAQIASNNGLYHPQVLADLQKAKLVMKNGRLGRSFKYIADPDGRGIIPQQVEVEIELYEDASGNFMTRTYMRGQQEDVGKPVRFLGSRKVRIDVPGVFSPDIKEVVGDVAVDAEYDPYEVHKAKKNRSDANVIIDVNPVDAAYERYARDMARPSGLLQYHPDVDEGCIIEQ